MHEAIEKMNRFGKRARIVRCVETGETGNISEWSEKFSVARGVGKKSIANQIYAALSNKKTVYGLSFEWVK